MVTRDEAVWTEDHVRARATFWERAACIGLPTDNWFPEETRKTHAEYGFSAMRAKQICNRCPIIDDCRDYAVPRAWIHGVWGGLTYKERQQMRAAGDRAKRR